MQILTVGIGGVGLVSSYVSYSPEIAARCVKLSNGFELYFLDAYFNLVIIYNMCGLLASLTNLVYLFMNMLLNSFYRTESAR